MLNLDTHILIHALAGSLKPKEEALLRRHTWSISSIAIWEIAKLFQQGRISVGLDSPLLDQTLKTIRIWEITPEICRNLLDLDFKADPADEIIASTSITHRVPLVTRDPKILASSKTPIAR